MQVVEDQHDRALAGGEREHPRDGLEEPVAARLGLLGERLAQLGHVPAQAGDEAGELGQLERELGRQVEVLAVGDVVVSAVMNGW